MTIDFAIQWQEGSALPQIFFSGSLLTVFPAWFNVIVFGPLMCSLALVPRTLEFRQRGLIVFQGWLTHFIPWTRVKYGTWFSVPGRLQILIRFRWFEFDVSEDKKEATLAVLRSVVELRDEYGYTLNPEIHASERSVHCDAAIPARPFQFSLRTLLLFTLVASTLMSWYGIRHRRDSAEKAALAGLDSFKPLSMTFSDNRLWLDFSFSNPKPGDRDLALLSSLETLYYLNLSGTTITDAGLVHLEHLNWLRSLDLLSTSVSDEGLRRLEKLPRLRYLKLYGTRVSDEGVKRFQRASPKVEVDR